MKKLIDSLSVNSVHFKVYVPEIINHQIHTKTVFIHVHKLTHPKKTKHKTEVPKTYHKESHHEDWSSWNTYDYHSDHDDQPDDNHIMSENLKDHMSNEIHNEKNREKTKPSLHQYRDSYLPALQNDNKPNYLKSLHGDMMGYSYPPQYEVQEDIKEIDHNNVRPYMHMYEEGYHRAGESANRHIYSNDSTKFYDDKHEKGDHSTEEYEKESKEETHAGRYFVDDSEYLHNGDKYEAEKRMSPKMFVSLRRNTKTSRANDI